MQLCGSLSILWHCLSLWLEWKLTFSSPVATAQFSKFAGILSTKFRLKLKKVGKTTRPFRYDLNQIPYDYTVEVTNRFKWLGLIECLKNYGWRFVTLYRRQWSRLSSRKRNAKWQIVGWESLTNSWEKKRSERQRRKGKIYTSECRVLKNSKER